MAVLVSQFVMVVSSLFAMVRKSLLLMSGLAVSVDCMVRGDMAGGARVAGQGIGRGIEDLAGETLDRLIDTFDDIWLGQGYGRDRCEQ